MSKDKMRDEVISVLQDLKDRNPDHGFVIVTVGTQHGREHILTYSNMPDDSVKYVAALIVEMGEGVEQSTKKRKKLH